MSSIDTNQASELFELCKEVSEKTGWKLPISERPVEYWVQHDDELDLEYGIAGMPVDGGITPLYTSDDLLEKLPQDLVNDNEVHPFTLYRGKYSKQWLAGYEGYFGGQNDPSETPLKALLKLTIALSEAGELK